MSFDPLPVVCKLEGPRQRYDHPAQGQHRGDQRGEFLGLDSRETEANPCLLPLPRGEELKAHDEHTDSEQEQDRQGKQGYRHVESLSQAPGPQYGTQLARFDRVSSEQLETQGMGKVMDAVGNAMGTMVGVV